ncbi:MAG: deoxynucleoside kinase [bacterium]
MPEIEREKESPHLFIQLLGVPASGKTTCAKYLGERLGFQVLEEYPVSETPLFDKYYTDPDKWAFPIQTLFLFESWRQVAGGASLGIEGVKEKLKMGSVISEPTIWQNAFYAQARLEGNPKELSWYQDFFNGLVRSDSFPKPDVLIYLKVSFPNMLRGIEERAQRDLTRKTELQESEGYWRRLWGLHEEWVNENPLGLKIITLDMDKYDFSSYNSDGEALEAAFGELKQRSGGLIK